MSLLNKIKGWGQKGGATPDHDLTDEVPFGDAYAPAGSASSHGQAGDPNSVSSLEVPTLQQPMDLDTSIISEAAPSGMAEFSETRLPDAAAPAIAAVGTGLPVIGSRPVVEQQRILLFMIVLGFIGLIAMTLLSVRSANQGSAQVGASGQALMQSQRLAKSVSQALIGNVPAFAEVRESIDVLAKNVRSLKTGEGGVAAAPSAVQGLLEPVLPLVDRAEKNATTILDQQKILTQVGEALRSINRQSSDLLEIAETISSLKLQQGAPPSELSAAGQLVMLTQRIGLGAHAFHRQEFVGRLADALRQHHQLAGGRQL